MIETGQGRSRGEQTRWAILVAAIARFGRDGYRATSVADIARDASVSGTAVYAYFPNKEALFLAAVDEDAAAVINEGVASFLADPERADWRENLMLTLLSAVERHPLAERLLAGLEPEVTHRVLDIPALEELRKAVADRLGAEQITGHVRTDIDPGVTANGIVTIVLSLLTSVVRFGRRTLVTYGEDVAAVLQAAVEQRPPSAG